MLPAVLKLLLLLSLYVFSNVSALTDFAVQCLEVFALLFHATRND